MGGNERSRPRIRERFRLPDGKSVSIDDPALTLVAKNMLKNARGLNPNSSFAWIIARSSQLRCV